MLTQPAQATSTVRTREADWQTFLRAIAEKASTDKHHRFGDLYRWLNQDVLRVGFWRLRQDAARGVDGVTFEEYERDLESNLADLAERLKRKAYRARLVRRKYIPKGNGKLRPLGLPVREDKLLQMAVTQILLAIFERDFRPCSYGYRPGSGAPAAIRDLSDELPWEGHHFVVEADIKGFLDHLRWEWLEKMLAQRIQDEARMSLIRKGLRAGILEEAPGNWCPCATVNTSAQWGESPHQVKVTGPVVESNCDGGIRSGRATGNKLPVRNEMACKRARI